MQESSVLAFIAGKLPIFNFEGGILSAPVRHLFMVGTVWYLTQKEKCAAGLQILEIGSWLGASALSWGEGLIQHNEGIGTITCIDAWQPYFDLKPTPDSIYQRMDIGLRTDAAYHIFLHNLSTLPSSITAQHLRGLSENILPLLKPDNLDIVFIDGNHAYSAVLQDIKLALPLVKQGGIICGDDLNLQLGEVDLDLTLESRKKDYIKDPGTGRGYHPGVTLAVHEVFGTVSAWGGYWAMQKLDNEWHPISLAGMPIHFPRHLPSKSLREAELHLKDINII